MFKIAKFFSSLALVSCCLMMVSCGKRKPTIPTKLITQKSVTVGTRSCDSSDYPLFLGCSKFYLPSNTELVQLYVKNESDNSYKFTGNDIQLSSSEETNARPSTSINYRVSAPIAKALLVEIPVNNLLTITSTVLLTSIIMDAPLSTFLLMPTPFYLGMAGLYITSSALYSIRRKSQLRKLFEENVITSSSNIASYPSSEINKVFFVTKQDFKSVQKDGIHATFVDYKTGEKLIFALQI